MTIQHSLFCDMLESQKPIILDGGLATELEAQGFQLDSNLWSAELLLNHPEAIVNAHKSYFNAGAQCSISASYQASIEGFINWGLSKDDAEKLIKLSVELVIKARDEFLSEQNSPCTKPLVAASVGPYGAILADGSEYTGQYHIDDTALKKFHRERLAILDNCGADVLACETIPSMQEASVLHELLKECKTPSWVSFSCKDDSHLNDGTPIAECAKLFNHHPKTKAIGINCSAPQHINGLINAIKTVNPNQHIVVYPNSGETYDANNNSWHGTSSPIECGLAAQNWQHSGANIIGGCCRMGPQHIQQIKQHLS